MHYSSKSIDKISFNTVAATCDGNQDFFILTIAITDLQIIQLIHMIICYSPPTETGLFHCALSPPVSSFAMALLRCRNLRGATDRWFWGKVTEER